MKLSKQTVLLTLLMIAINFQQPSKLAAASQEKKKKKLRNTAVFDWKEPYVRKFQFKIYFLTKVKDPHGNDHASSLIDFKSGYLERELSTPINKLKR